MKLRVSWWRRLPPALRVLLGVLGGLGFLFLLGLGRLAWAPSTPASAGNVGSSSSSFSTSPCAAGVHTTSRAYTVAALATARRLPSSSASLVASVGGPAPSLRPRATMTLTTT